MKAYVPRILSDDGMIEDEFGNFPTLTKYIRMDDYARVANLVNEQRDELRLLSEQVNEANQELLRRDKEITRLRGALTKTRRELWHCNDQLKYKGATEGYSVTEALREADAILTQEPT